LKPLPDEIEILKIFDAIKSCSDFKCPTIDNVNLDCLGYGRRRLGTCNDVGIIEICISPDIKVSADNYNFVNTVVHEVVHYNQTKLSHNDKFYADLKELLGKVINKLNERRELC